MREQYRMAKANGKPPLHDKLAHIMNNRLRDCASSDRGQEKRSFISATHGLPAAAPHTSVWRRAPPASSSQRRWLFRPRLVETGSRLLKLSSIASTRSDFQCLPNRRRLFESHGNLQDRQEIEGVAAAPQRNASPNRLAPCRERCDVLSCRPE